MTVAELIAELQKMPQDLPAVAYDGYDPSDLQEVEKVVASAENFRSQKEDHKHAKCVLLTT